MITIDPIYVCDVPLSRKVLGFPQEGDRANAVLLVVFCKGKVGQFLREIFTN